jgi:hypothetical protein
MPWYGAKIQLREIAHENIKQSQIKMKQWYDRDGRIK